MSNFFSIRKVFRLAFALFLATTLSLLGGCGPGTTATSITALVDVVLLDSKGAEVTSVSPDAAVTVQARVTDDTGLPVANTIVTFAVTDTTLAKVSQQNVLTDSQGIATVSLLSTGTKTDATSITASASVTTATGAATISGQASFTALAGAGGGVPAEPTLTVQLTNSSGAAITTISPSVTGTVKATVLDGDGNPVQGVVVTFSLTDATLATISPAATALTNASGVASITLTPKAPGATSISASATVYGVQLLGSTTFSVTTGTPFLSLSLSSTTVTTGNPATVIATLTDGTGARMSGVTVTFSVDDPTLATVTASAVTNINGEATATITAGTGSGTASVTATAPVTDPIHNNIATSSPASFTVGATISALSLSASPTTVKSDNSNFSTVTVSALDNNNAKTPNVVISLSTDTGIISTNTVTTNANGDATFTFQSGTANKANRTATITANAGVAAHLPIQITGSTLTVNASGTTVPDDGTSPVTMTFTARDAGGNPISGAAVTLTKPVGVTLTPPSGQTNASGQLVVTVTGTAAVSGNVTGSAVGATAAAPITVTSAAATFSIVDAYVYNFASATNTQVLPAPPTTAVMKIGSLTPPPLSDELVIIVDAPSPTLTVTFATTMGLLDNGVDPLASVVDVPVAVGAGTCGTAAVPYTAGQACAVLTTTSAGLANVQVYDKDAPSTSDTLAVSMTATVPKKITLQATPSTIPKSVGSTTGVSTLIATVKDENDQPVGGVPVSFTIVNPTGGGEFISPVVVNTASVATSSLGLGQVMTTFTSGSQSSGAGGVMVHALVNGTAVETGVVPSGSDAKILIGGSAGSIAFGMETHLGLTAGDTAYTLPMSVIVTDAGGNPVPGATVNLSAWPIGWSTGYSCAINIAGGVSGTGNVANGSSDVTNILGFSAIGKEGQFVSGGGFPSGTIVVSVSSATSFTASKPSAIDGTNVPISLGQLSTYLNEDINENLFLDSGEDGLRTYYYGGGSAGAGTPDSLITPVNAAAGSIPGTVITDSTGLASFTLTYPKTSAIWIVDRIRARTVVQGSETASEIQFPLAPLESDVTPVCRLGDSPYTF